MIGAKLKPPLERFEQEAYFTWLYFLRYQGERIWDYAYAVPNGSHLQGDKRRRAIQANKLKSQGMKPGVPDVVIDIPVEPYHGLRIEMKRIGAPKPGDDQSMWHARLRKRGYYVAVCHGLEQAQAITRTYFQLQKG